MENNPFRQKPGFHKKNKQVGVSRNKVDTRGKLNKKEKEWGMQKFTPVVKTQLPIPWSTFKNEIIQKQQEEAKLLNNPNMESEEARQFLKKRDQNFRRSEIAEGRKEDIKWEDFSETAHRKSTEKRRRRKQIKKIQRNKDKSPLSQNSFPVVDEAILNNFESKKLTSHQNNRIRKMITKTTYLARGAPIESVVNDLKRRGLKPTKKLV